MTILEGGFSWQQHSPTRRIRRNFLVEAESSRAQQRPAGFCVHYVALYDASKTICRQQFATRSIDEFLNTQYAEECHRTATKNQFVELLTCMPSLESHSEQCAQHAPLFETSKFRHRQRLPRFWLLQVCRLDRSRHRTATHTRIASTQPTRRSPRLECTTDITIQKRRGAVTRSHNTYKPSLHTTKTCSPGADLSWPGGTELLYIHRKCGTKHKKHTHTHHGRKYFNASKKCKPSLSAYLSCLSVRRKLKQAQSRSRVAFRRLHS